MLGTLLEKLGTLLPKTFIIANLFPMLLFAAVNGLMLYWFSDTFRHAVRTYFTMGAGDQALIGFPILIAVTLAAYIFSTLNLFQREILEGQYLPGRLKSALTAGQRRRADDSDDQILQIKKLRRSLNRFTGADRLSAARDVGNQLLTECDYSKRSAAAIAVARLARKRMRNEMIGLEELDNAVDRLAQELRRCPVDNLDPARPDDYKCKVLLDRDEGTFLKCLEYVKTRVENDYVALFNRKEFNYSSFRLAPTAMGNIAESVRGYTLSRYAMNLDALWSRLQKLLIDDEKFYSILVDAKTQLDFLISLFWLTVGFTIIWTVELFYLRRSPIAFLLVAVGGPVLSMLWYKIALQNYRAFADICRTSVDLYRFQLLDSLHIEQPKGNLIEQKIWEKVNDVIGFGELDTEIRYHHPPPPKT
jgi:hypothetical protein